MNNFFTEFTDASKHGTQLIVEVQITYTQRKLDRKGVTITKEKKNRCQIQTHRIQDSYHVTHCNPAAIHLLP